MKKTLALLLAMFIALPSGMVLAEKKKLTYPVQLAPTVELREDGFAYSTKVREQKRADYQMTYSEAPTKVAKENGDVEHMQNKSFEFVGAGNTLTSWGKGGVEGGKLNESGAFIVEDKVEGKQALRLTAPEGKNVHVLQSIDNIVGGEEYEISGWCKRTSGTASVTLTVYYKDPETGIAVEYANRVQLPFSENPVKEWAQRTVKFVMPEDATQVTLMVRLMNGGEMIWDDFSMLGPEKKVSEVVMPEYIAPDENTENLIKNGSFEEDEAVRKIVHGEEGVDYWFVRDNEVLGDLHAYTEEEAHSGKRSVKVAFESPAGSPWIGQTVEVKPDTTYQFSMWVKLGEATQYSLKVQADCYNGGPEQTNEHYVKDGQRSVKFSVDKEERGWQRLVANFTTYTDCTHYCILIRNGEDAPYEMWFDDVELYPLDGLSAKVRTFNPDCVFYYSDWEGYGNAELNCYTTTLVPGTKVRFRFLDGETVKLEQVLTLREDGSQTFTYPLELLSEKKKEYKLEAVLLDEAGQPTDDRMERIIYKYDRPTMLDETQKLMDAEGNRVEHYVLAQGTGEEVMWRVPEVGATIGRAIGSGRTDRLEKLDIAHQAGMKATVTLYNKKDIRDPEVMQEVIDRINLVKDHPALIGWYLWEEPSFRGDDIDLDENLRIGAKLIRDMDPKHPLLGVISVQDYYGEFGKYCDMMDLDCYPTQIYDGTRGQYIANNVARALKDTNWQKPISIMNQAFEWFEYKPTWQELRNFTYQAFFEGANGFSFHTFDGYDATSENGTAVILDDDYWKEMEKAADWEYGFMFDHFTLMKSPLFNEARTDDVRWRTVIHEGELYAIAISMWENKKVSADIPLTDFTGKITVDGAKAELVAGEGTKSIDISGNTFHVEMDGLQALVYKITPNTPTDFSSVKPSRFRDLYNHVWARDAIIEIDEKGIGNDVSAIAFGPGRNITRGEFAMFLVETLGLTGDGSKVSFDDVNQNREYAECIAIGKAAGILNGVGDNKFNPDAEISRQDMMTIISRGMALSGESDLSVYSDNGQIADYALPHVQAMIAFGLVQGNADGTINPLGQTTRAETAVIMQRILNQ